ncbi:MAG: hypothetical protein M3Z26_00365 [Bacteroidota bacterium]|nr:hypothetical protein [Bacteroidota bacterium]
MSNKSTASEQFTSSSLIGFSLGFIIVFLAHLLPKDWSFVPVSSNGSFTYNAKVLSCGYKCALGINHSVDCSGITAYDVGKHQLTFGELLSATFDGHISTILIIGAIASILIFIVKRSKSIEATRPTKTFTDPVGNLKQTKSDYTPPEKFDDTCPHCGGLGWEYYCMTCYTKAVLEPSTEKYDGDMYCPKCAENGNDSYKIKEDLCSVCGGSGKDPDPPY